MILPKYRPEEYSKEAIAALMPAVKRREQDAINKVILLIARMAIKLGRRDEELQLQAMEKLVEVVTAMSNRPQEEKDPRTFIIMSVQRHLTKRRVKNNLFHVSPQFWKKSGKEFSKKYFGYEVLSKIKEEGGTLKRKGWAEFKRNSIELFTLPAPDWSFTRETIAGMRPMARQVTEMCMSGMTDVEIGAALRLSKARIGQIKKEAQDYARTRFQNNGMGEIVRQYEKQPTQGRRLLNDGGRIDDPSATEAGGGS